MVESGYLSNGLEYDITLLFKEVLITALAVKFLCYLVSSLELFLMQYFIN